MSRWKSTRKLPFHNDTSTVKSDPVNLVDPNSNPRSLRRGKFETQMNEDQGSSGMRLGHYARSYSSFLITKIRRTHEQSDGGGDESVAITKTSTVSIHSRSIRHGEWTRTDVGGGAKSVVVQEGCHEILKPNDGQELTGCCGHDRVYP